MKHQKKLIVVCDNIRSLYNIGSIFRTGDALGVDKIYLCGITGTPLQAGLKKVSLGAEKSVRWEYVKSTWQLVNRLKKEGLQIISLEQTSTSVSIKQVNKKLSMALVLGNEINGVSKGVLQGSDKIIHLPMKGIKESLNVSVAFGIAGYYLMSNW